MSSNQNGEKNDEQTTTKDEETECDEGGLDRIINEEEREGQIQTEQNDEENGGWRRIPVTLTAIKVGGFCRIHFTNRKSFTCCIIEGWICRINIRMMGKILFCCIIVGCILFN